MAVLRVLQYPDPLLLNRSAEIENIDDEVRQIAQDLVDTLYSSPGTGIAAPQIGYRRRMIAIDPERQADKGNPQVLINPVIIAHEGERIFREGCLSVPQYTANVKRHDKVTVKAMDIEGNQLRIDAEDFLAILLQHEMDHLDGVLFIHRAISVGDLFTRKSYSGKKRSKKKK